ncbi:hypothetical protein [Caballeronia sp. dw_19]|uniref:hypothetical protein n=1 Tax=Caballeronia sp. dw_19 TaxID=2719791 RepID=UPI001BD059DE|nr:hypothetical protein [Caballeronia sp. dw_19]
MTRLYSPGTSLSFIETDALAKTYAYNADGTLKTETCVNGTTTLVKTYTYTAGKLTGESAWVAQ